MTYFRNFTAPLWQLFAGDLLLLACLLFYLIWWAVSFRPGSEGNPAGTVFILAAFVTGIAAVLLTAGGINALSQESKTAPVKFILLGVAVLFLILLPVTSIVFHRIATSELMIIHTWLALELSVLSVLYGTGRFRFGPAAALTVLVTLAFIASMICYILYYQLPETAGYYAGMVPLGSAAFVMAVFAGVLAVS